MLLSFIICNFLVRMLKYLEKKMFFWPQKVEKTTSKSCILMAVTSFFLSAAPTAQNSPEVHLCFIDSFIQSSLLMSLIGTLRTVQQLEKTRKLHNFSPKII